MSRLKEIFVPPPTEAFEKYKRKHVDPALIDASRITLSLIDQIYEKQHLNTPIAGDVALVLSYKQQEGVVLSFDLLDDSEIKILQLQGVKRKPGYRLQTGILVSHVFADNVQALADHAQSNIKRITLPHIYNIDGIETVQESGVGRYMELISRLKLKYSDHERLYVREI